MTIWHEGADDAWKAAVAIVERGAQVMLPFRHDEGDHRVFFESRRDLVERIAAAIRGQRD